jgi:hypothetical protein
MDLVLADAYALGSGLPRILWYVTDRLILKASLLMQSCEDGKHGEVGLDV